MLGGGREGLLPAFTALPPLYRYLGVWRHIWRSGQNRPVDVECHICSEYRRGVDALLRLLLSAFIRPES